MRILVICLMLSFASVSVGLTQTSEAGAKAISTCEPTVFSSNPISLHDIRHEQGSQSFSKWLMNKMRNISRMGAECLHRGKKYLSKKIASFLGNDSVHLWLQAAKYVTNEKEESSGLSIGVWALLTFLLAVFSFAASPGFGLLVLLTSFILAIIGTVRDKDGLAILILVLSGLTFLLVLVFAMFEALLAITFFGL
ncbi:MAG: hypothetical protein GVX78_02940 [Bacteroidetes bacterium]|jgi:hypothetical protein|nr:hypothetical protein [Bacteroidota bacterium]